MHQKIYIIKVVRVIEHPNQPFKEKKHGREKESEIESEESEIEIQSEKKHHQEKEKEVT
jgi:hypothetical protein